jgi:hypothetical protein
MTSEDKEQAAVISWIKLQYPLAGKLIYAVPNGGIRHIGEAVKLKKTGVRAGVPDLCLPMPRGEYHGLYLEMKRKEGGRLSANQKEYLDLLFEQGYAATWVEGFEEAKEIITHYIEKGLLL